MSADAYDTASILMPIYSEFHTNSYDSSRNEGDHDFQDTEASKSDDVDQKPSEKMLHTLLRVFNPFGGPIPNTSEASFPSVISKHNVTKSILTGGKGANEDEVMSDSEAKEKKESVT